tara:strand:- start:83 stop:256 length:174 start_codon:yes stop_codon:yes gene_type:complete
MFLRKFLVSDPALQAEFEVADFGALREFEEIFKLNSFFKDDIVDGSGLFILKMAVII